MRDGARWRPRAVDRAGRSASSHRRAVALAAIVAVAGASSALAQPKAPAIAWEAPPECPRLADVSSWLAAVLPPEVAARVPELSARVVVTKRGGRYEAVVTLGRDAELTERRLEGARCEELARSAVVIVSVALTEAAEPVPSASPSTSAAPSNTPSARTVQTARPPGSKPPPSRPVVPPARERRMLYAGGGLQSGLGAPALRLDAALRSPLAERLALGARLRGVRATDLDLDRGASAMLTLVAPGVELCAPIVLAQALRGSGCVRGELGWVSARGGGANGARDAGWWSAAAGVVGIEWGESLRVWAAVDGEVRLIRPEFALNDGAVLGVGERVAAGVVAGLAVALP